jgi:hypothetical protein
VWTEGEKSDEQRNGDSSNDVADFVWRIAQETRCAGFERPSSLNVAFSSAFHARLENFGGVKPSSGDEGNGFGKTWTSCRSSAVLLVTDVCLGDCLPMLLAFRKISTEILQG